MQEFLTTLNNIATDIKNIAPVLAGLILIVIGLLWITAKDPQKKEQYQGWMLNVFIGVAIVFLGSALVTWFTGKVVGF